MENKEYKLYGLPNCSKCEEIKSFLTSKSIPFQYTNETNQIATVGSKYRIRSAPILLIVEDSNEKALSYDEILKSF